MTSMTSSTTMTAPAPAPATTEMNHEDHDTLPPFEDFIVTDAPEQKLVNGVRVPFIVSPPRSSSSSISFETIDHLHQFVQTYRCQIDRLVQYDVGAVLFRGFPCLQTPNDFHQFVCLFDNFHDLSYDRSMSFAVRKRYPLLLDDNKKTNHDNNNNSCYSRICTTNEGKSGGLVFHHEQAQTPLWPSHVFFCCEQPAAVGDGGQTGLVSSVDVYTRLQQQFPDFCTKCESHGVQYTVYAGPTQDPTKGAGRSWKSFFHVTTKQECEAKMKAGGWTWQWGVGVKDNGTAVVGDDFLKCTTPVLDCVKVSPHGTPPGEGSGGDKQNEQKKCFFNQLIATIANAAEFSKVSDGNDSAGSGYNPATDVPTQAAIDACVRFGNGESIPLDVLLAAKDICEELAVNVQWQKGDVALISNYLMMHARRPWVGPAGTRKLVAALVAEENCTSFGKPLVAL